MTKKVWTSLVILFVAINALGLGGSIFMIDSSLYANISKSFVRSGEWFHIYQQGSDWLDKPHFPFWLCAWSMKVFGVNAFAYKLPSFLGFLVGLFYTYKLAQRLYNTETARLAVLILASSIHIIVSNNDVRAEAILLGLIMGAVYHAYVLSISSSKWMGHLLLAAAFTGASIMTKGIFVLIIVFAAVWGSWLSQKLYPSIFHYKWGLFFILVLLCILPELYALYIQFDLHPEKIVFGKQNVSGIRFFFWDSQFGRFTNSGPIKGSGDYFFYVHTMLWAFAPWVFIAYARLAKMTIPVVRLKYRGEYVCYFGFMLMFLVFSLSKFQLPHYLNIIYPFLSILVADTILTQSKTKAMNMVMKISAYGYGAIALCLVVLISYFFKPTHVLLNGWVLAVSALAVSLCILLYLHHHKHLALILLSSATIGLFLNLNFYPALLRYQSGTAAAQYVNQHYPNHQVVSTEVDWLFEFYTDKNVKVVTDMDALRKFQGQQPSVVVYANEDMLSAFAKAQIAYKPLASFENFHITMLTGEFVNYRTRKDVLNKRVLVSLESP